MHPENLAHHSPPNAIVSPAVYRGNPSLSDPINLRSPQSDTTSPVTSLIKMHTARKIFASSLRATLLASLLLLGPLCLLNLLQVFNNVEVVPRFHPVARAGIQCVMFHGNSSVEDLADLVNRNQLAFFIASLYHASVSFLSSEGADGKFKNHFSNCNMPHPTCILRQEDVGYLSCPRGDCGCIALKLSSYLHPLSDCTVLGVESTGYGPFEYSGCMGDVLRRYFGHASRWPRAYDAVHFVDGSHEADLASVVEGKLFSPDRFRSLMYALCVLSERDIIVVTEGTPQIPLCENRTVLANVTMLQAMKIMQKANHVSVGSNSLGILMMEMSTPERVVLLSEVYNKFLWVKIPLITLVRKDGHMFHFSYGDSELQGDVETELEQQRFASEPLNMLTEPRVPTRKWEDEAEPF